MDYHVGDYHMNEARNLRKSTRNGDMIRFRFRENDSLNKWVEGRVVAKYNNIFELKDKNGKSRYYRWVDYLIGKYS